MGVVTFADEYTSPVPPTRLFKALMIDSHNLIPKLLPQAVKSMEIIEGDGGAGTIKKITFAEGSQFSYVKQRVDALDLEKLIYSYSVIEGDALVNLESVSYDVKLEPAPDGGSISKVISKYFTKGDVVPSEEEIKSGKERVLGMTKVVEAYLLQNPDAYN